MCFKPLWVFSEVSSNAIWDYRWRDADFPLSPLSVVSILAITLLECQGVE